MTIAAPYSRVAWLIPKRQGRGIGIPTVAQCTVTLMVIKAALAVGGLGRTLRWIRRSVAHAPTTVSVANEDVIALEYAVAKAAAMYPGRAMCMERSLVLLYLAKRVGIAVSYHHGVHPVPFKAHAWIELGNCVINDIPEHVRCFVAFPPIFR